MRIHYLGVRGSTPAPGHLFERYGGNTSCVAIDDGEGSPRLVLDAGTGLRALADLLPDAVFRGTILLTHLHWDHTHGLPFAPCVDHPDAEVRLLVPAQDGDPEGLIERFMSPPQFPIRPQELGGAWSFGDLDEGRHPIEGFEVLAREIPHKGGRTFGYRISTLRSSGDRSSVAYLPDHGPAALGPGGDGFGLLHPAALELADGVDVLIHDAQHTAAEFARYAAYGHSAADYALRLGETAGARQVVLFHHGPRRTDDEEDELVEALVRSSRSAVAISAAREGTCTIVPAVVGELPP